jgi:sugar/nucleoside kinase (ribokinase family)
VIKRGEYGSMLADRQGHYFVLPAFPTSEVKDPTGAGDSFAGAFMGYLARIGQVDINTLKSAMAYGTVAASFAIEDFSLAGITRVTAHDIESRLGVLRMLTAF